MKVLASVMSAIVATGLIFGGTILILVAAPSQSGGLVFLAVCALTVFVYGPLVLGSIVAYWDVRKSDDSRRHIRLWFAVVLGLEALGAVAIAVYAVVTRAPAWLP